MSVDLEYVLAELRKELIAIDQAIASLERLERSGNPRVARAKDLSAVHPTKGTNHGYRTATPGQE
jgi:hypothetical protein